MQVATRESNYFDQRQQADTPGCGRERDGKCEREIDMDLSASSSNISLVSDTSTSSPSSSTDDLFLSPSLPPQPLLPSVRVFPSQHPDQLLDPGLFSTPDAYPPFFGAGMGGGLGLGISIPKKDSECGNGNAGIVPFSGLGLVGLGRRRSRALYASALPGLYPLDEEEDLEEVAGGR